MILKKEFLNGTQGFFPIKDVFRKFQVECEIMLSESEGLSLSPWNRFLLETGFPQEWRHKRQKNRRKFIELIAKAKNFEFLFSNWPKEHCPFNVILILPSKKIRTKYYDHFISKNVYVSIHWVLDPNAQPHALDLSKRILTIPVDQRYGSEDLERIASILMSFKS